MSNSVTRNFIRAEKAYMVSEDLDANSADLSDLLGELGVTSEDEEEKRPVAEIEMETNEGVKKFSMVEVLVPTIIDMDIVCEVCAVYSRPDLTGFTFDNGEQKVIKRDYEEVFAIFEDTYGEFK